MHSVGVGSEIPRGLIALYETVQDLVSLTA